MHIVSASILSVLMSSAALLIPLPSVAAGSQPVSLVEFERMTWPELKAAIAGGKTTALIYTGGVEQRGPHNATGGHNMMSYATVKAIAERLGDAIFLPVLPYTPNNASADMPGTIGITPELLRGILERLTEQSIVNGFKNVVLMSDHGGGQPKIYEEVANTLNAKYSPQGIHVYYCDQVYKPANEAFDKDLQSRGYPSSLHGGIPDTSSMMYLDPDNIWVRRDLLATAVGDPVVDGKRQVGPNSPRNGITGDARRSSAALGKEMIELKVDYAVKQIKGFTRQP